MGNIHEVNESVVFSLLLSAYFFNFICSYFLIAAEPSAVSKEI